jgi:hypothetical protein
MPKALHNWRFLSTLLLFSLLAACSQPKSEHAPIASGESVICSPTENLAACYFKGALLQGDSPVEPLQDALRDAVNLPLGELRAKRYVGTMGEPNKRAFEEVMGDYFTPGSRMKNGDRIDAGSEGFIEAIKQPEGMSALKKVLADLEEGIRQEESGN